MPKFTEHYQNSLSISMIQGVTAPRYDSETVYVRCQRAVITEKGTQGQMPIVDFQLEDEKGKKYFLVLSGKLVTMLGAAIKGVNVRNHGKEEP